jgi:hypothetical protein
VPPATKTPAKPSVAAPERSLVQRMEALERANQIRTRRAQLKRDLKAGRTSIHDLLLEPPEFVETAKVFDMLLAVPKYGRVKVNKVLVNCRISPSKTIGGLSQRQRTELVSMLRRSRSTSTAGIEEARPAAPAPRVSARCRYATSRRLSSLRRLEPDPYPAAVDVRRRRSG